MITVLKNDHFLTHSPPQKKKIGRFLLRQVHRQGLLVQNSQSTKLAPIFATIHHTSTQSHVWWLLPLRNIETFAKNIFFAVRWEGSWPSPPGGRTMTSPAMQPSLLKNVHYPKLNQLIILPRFLYVHIYIFIHFIFLVAAVYGFQSNFNT